METFVLPAHSCIGCCSYRLSRDTAWHAQSCISEKQQRKIAMHHLMEQSLCCLRDLVRLSCSLSTQLLALVYFLSRCYTPAACPECCHRNITAISRTIGAHTLAVLAGFLHKWLSFKLTLAGCQRNQVIQKSYFKSACGSQLSC